MQNLKVDSLARFLLFLSLLHSLQYVKKFFGLKPTSLMEKFLKKTKKKSVEMKGRYIKFYKNSKSMFVTFKGHTV